MNRFHREHAEPWQIHRGHEDDEQAHFPFEAQSPRTCRWQFAIGIH